MGSWYHPNMREKTGHLTPTEHRLLEHLVRNAGRIVTHNELLEAIGRSVSSRHVLRQLISRLRNKVEVDPALPRVIITHHRQGYSFAGKEEGRWFAEDEE